MNICYTGGGTGGHIFPIFPIDATLLEKDPSIRRFFIGRHSELEQSWVEREGIRYYQIQSGKLRRYFSFLNFIDIFKVVIAIFQALYILHKEKPSIVFSKGGYVSVPVVIGSWMLKIPIISHESDATPGLANRIAINFASVMCVAHKEVISYFPEKKRGKCVVTGIPSRVHKENHTPSLHFGSPLIAIFGGSQGALQINKLIAPIIEEITSISYVVHQTGKDKGEYVSKTHYEVHEFIEDEYIDILSQADIVISRSGATALADYIEMEVPSILIPLGKKASRGDQILNAKRLECHGAAVVVDSEKISSNELLQIIKNLLENKEQLENMKLQLKKLKKLRAEILIASIILDTGSQKNDTIEKIVNKE